MKSIKDLSDYVTNLCQDGGPVYLAWLTKFLFDKRVLGSSDNKLALGWLPVARRMTSLVTKAGCACLAYLCLFYNLYQNIYLSSFLVPSIQIK